MTVTAETYQHAESATSYQREDRTLNGAVRCKARKKTGERCKNPAIRGVDVCRHHGGAAPQVRRAAERRVAEQAAREAGERHLDLNNAPQTIPVWELAKSIDRAAHMVSFINSQIANLKYDEVAGLMVTKVTDNQGVERTVGANVWVKLLGEWEDRLQRASKAALDVGLEERKLAIEMAQVTVLVDAIKLVLGDLGVDPDAPEVQTTVSRRILALAEGVEDGGSGL